MGSNARIKTVSALRGPVRALQLATCDQGRNLVVRIDNQVLGGSVLALVHRHMTQLTAVSTFFAGGASFHRFARGLGVGPAFE